MARSIYITSPSPLFYAVYDRIVPGPNKYMATLFNNSIEEEIITIVKIYRLNWQAAGVADNVLDQYLARITARTGGTAIPIRSVDIVDIIPLIIAETGSTGVVEDHIIRRVPAASAEFQLDSNLKNLPAFESNAGLIWQKMEGMKGLILRQNEGISIRNVSNITTGSVSYVIEFTRVLS